MKFNDTRVAADEPCIPQDGIYRPCLLGREAAEPEYPVCLAHLVLALEDRLAGIHLGKDAPATLRAGEPFAIEILARWAHDIPAHP
jgi:hypothetical protein